MKHSTNGVMLRGRMQKERVARQKQTAAVIAEIRKKMADYGLTAADLGSAVKKPGTRKAVAVKYRNAATGESWSGRGRPPHWLADELAKGRKREEFLVG